MSENVIEKQTKEVIGNSKSAVAKAMVLMSISMDNMTKAIVDNQKKVDDRISALECKTDGRFEELRFFTFLGKYGWMSALFFVALVILLIWSVRQGDPTAVIKTIK